MKFKSVYTTNHYIIQVMVFIIVAIVGFYPGFISVLSGERPNPPAFVHIHAIVMLLWLALLLIQVSLVRFSRVNIHRIAGLFSVLLAPVLVISLCYVSLYGLYSAIGTAAMEVKSNIFWMQCYSVVLFTWFYIWALSTRKRDPETHKRAIVMSTLILLHAAIGRISWLPFYDVPNNVNAVHLYNFTLILPSLVYDVLTIGKIHRTYIIGLSVFAVCILITAIVWGELWWLNFVYVMFGYL